MIQRNKLYILGNSMALLILPKSKFNLIFFYLRAVGMEYDDLNSKSREAEKDVNMMQMKIQEVNNNLYRYQKERECKFFFLAYRNDTILKYFIFIYVFRCLLIIVTRMVFFFLIFFSFTSFMF